MNVVREVDSVSSIHKRWFFTLINPSSYKTSLIVYELTTAIIVCIYQLLTPDSALAFGIDIALAISVVSTGIFLDYVLLQGTPVNKTFQGYPCFGICKLTMGYDNNIRNGNELSLGKNY